MADESESIVTHRQIFLFFCLSVVWGVCIPPLVHAFLGELASELGWDPLGFNTVSPYTSIRIGLVGGAYTSSLVLGGAYITHDMVDDGFLLSTLLCGIMLIIGGIQGGIGSIVLCQWSVVVDGQEVPDVLGTGGASVVGYLGGILAFVIAAICVFLYDRFLRFTLCERCRCTASQDVESTCNYIPPAQDSKPH